MPRLLFLCTGNACRSQMAEAWTRAFWPELDVFSAGAHPGAKVDPLAVRAMAERGIDISAARPKGLADLPYSAFDVAITLCDKAAAHCPRILGAVRIVHQGFADPPALAGHATSPEQAMDSYRQVRDAIAEAVRRLPEVYPELFGPAAPAQAPDSHDKHS